MDVSCSYMFTYYRETVHPGCLKVYNYKPFLTLKNGPKSLKKIQKKNTPIYLVYVHFHTQYHHKDKCYPSVLMLKHMFDWWHLSVLLLMTLLTTHVYLNMCCWCVTNVYSNKTINSTTIRKMSLIRPHKCIFKCTGVKEFQ